MSSESSLRVIIADDHVVLRQGLRALMEKGGLHSVVAEASDGFEVLPLVEQLLPDVLIMDLSMPNLGGLETLIRMQKLETAPGVLVLSARDDEQTVSQVLEAGAKGFVPKSAAADELLFAIQAVSRGQTYLSPSVCGAVMKGKSGSNESHSPLESLSSREREVMKLLSEGCPNRDVAKRLHISPRTIDSHRANIMKKLGISSNAELVQTALKYGLVE